MSDTAPCAWCGKDSITEVVVVKGRKNRRTQPVCALHAEQFETRGALTLRIEKDKLATREAARAEHLRRTMPWLNKG